MAPELVGAGEDEQPSSYLSKVLQRVGRRDHPVAFLTFTVPVPDEGEHGVPVRFKANADELADDEAEPALDRVFVIRRRSD